MHRDLAPERGKLVLAARQLERNDDADLAQSLRHRIVHVAADRTRLHGDARRATQGHVLADRCDRRIDGIVDGDVADFVGLDLVEVGADLKCHVGDHAHQALELIVAGDEVGLCIDLDHDALERADRDADQALSGNAAGFLGRLGEALLAKPVDRTRDVTAGLAEGGLAIHHARASHVAEFFDHLCGYVRHVAILFMSANSLSVPKGLSGRQRLTAAPRTRGQNYSTTPRRVLWPGRSSHRRGRAVPLPRRRCGRRWGQGRQSAKNGRYRDRSTSSRWRATRR